MRFPVPLWLTKLRCCPVANHPPPAYAYRLSLARSPAWQQGHAQKCKEWVSDHQGTKALMAQSPARLRWTCRNVWQARAARLAKLAQHGKGNVMNKATLLCGGIPQGPR